MGGLLQGIGQAKPVSEFINTALNFRQAENQNNMSQMQQKQEAMKLEEMQKQNDYLNQKVDAKMTPFFLSLPEAAQGEALKAFRAQGSVDENGLGTRRQMYQALGEIQKNKDVYPLLMKPVVDAKAQEVVKAFKKLRENPEDPQMRAAYDAAQVDYNSANGTLLKHIEDISKPTFGKPGEVPYYGGVPGQPIPKEPDHAYKLGQFVETPGPNGDKGRAQVIGFENGLPKFGEWTPTESADPAIIKELEIINPGLAGKRGTPEYKKAYESLLELKGNRINAVTYLGQNDQGDFIVGKTRGVGAGGPPQVVANPAGGQLKPNVVRPLGTQEQEKIIGASNIAHVLPDMIPFRDLVRAKGGPIIDQVRGKAAEKMIDAGMGSQTGLPPEAMNAHVAVTHLKTWATGMLKGAGSDVQRAQLIATLPTLYDSADVIDQKMRKTINIVKRITSNTIQSASAGGKAVPSDMYRQLADMEDFANQLGTGELPSDLPKGTVDLGNGTYKLPSGKTVRKQ